MIAMNKYFGTDGIRGVYGRGLDDKLAFKAGLALARHFGAGDYIVVRDTRASGPALEDAVIKGLYAGGAAVYKGGVLPTPAAAFLVKKHGGRAGIVISASHNPPEYNGIKVFDAHGLKIDEQTERALETLITACEDPDPDAMGKYKTLPKAAADYTDYLAGEVPLDLKGLRVFLDCGFGAAAGGLAAGVFRRLGAEVAAFNDTHDGARINAGTGALHPEFLLGKMKGAGGDAVGFSLDGDGDRLTVVRGGAVLDGDTVLYNLAVDMPLKGNAVAGTILSNLALEEQLAARGIAFYRTPVGDKYVANLLYEKGLTLGGEQSGHYIINTNCLTGDAVLAALYLLRFLYKDGHLRPHAVLPLYPQIQKSWPADPEILSDPDFQTLIRRGRETLGTAGRIVARMSGTEPIVRVMAEGRDPAAVARVMKEAEELFSKRG